MKKKQLNTSVIATFKDGSTMTFDTIELASEHTGLEVNSIKSRANKPGSGAKSKDGITFMWADESVRQHSRLPCPSPAPGAYSNSCPQSQ